VNGSEIQTALDDVFDQAIMFHSYTQYMRDYEIITYAEADPRTGIEPSYARYLFCYAVEAEVTTSIPPGVWRRSLDERLIDYEQGKNLDGYVWGLKWHLLDPGGHVVVDSPSARRWSDALGIDFYEIHIETNAHNMRLVAADLRVSKLEVGHAPFIVGAENHYVAPRPLD
jgi:hypothetical protein